MSLIRFVETSLSLDQGPLVHVSCAMAYALSGIFKGLRQNEGILWLFCSLPAVRGLTSDF